MVGEQKIVAAALGVFVAGAAIIIFVAKRKSTAAAGFLTSNERILANRQRTGRLPVAFPRAF